MSYVPSPTLQAYWDQFPFIVHFSAVRCPVHRQEWLRMDEIAEEAYCSLCERSWTTQEVVAAKDRSPQAPKPRLPADLRQYYPQGVVCPTCRTRLRLRMTESVGTCPTCDRTYRFAELIDVAARRLMKAAPHNAPGYHKPRHTR